MKKRAIELILKEQTMVLLPEKVIFWKERNTMIASDLHLSKAGHYRRAGLPVPTDADNENYLVMDRLMEVYKPERFIIVGDLIHSSYNQELERFYAWREKHSGLKITLVQGNHDVLPESFYKDCTIDVTDMLHEPPFVFIHEPFAGFGTKYYAISGHIHPGVTLIGKANQSLRLPCFYFGKEQALLPAFGTLTGHVRIPVKKGDEVFVVLEDQVCKVS